SYLNALGLTLLSLCGCATATHLTQGDAPALESESNLIMYQAFPAGYKKGLLIKDCDDSISRADKLVEAISKRPEAQRTFANSQLSFELALADLSDNAAGLTFMKYVTPNSELRDDSALCE